MICVKCRRWKSAYGSLRHMCEYCAAIAFREEWIAELDAKLASLGEKDWPEGTADSCILFLHGCSKNGYSLRRDWEGTKNTLLAELGRPRFELSPIKDHPKDWSNERMLDAVRSLPAPVRAVMNEMVGL